MMPAHVQGKVVAGEGSTGPFVSPGCKVLLLQLPSGQDAVNLSAESLEAVSRQVEHERQHLRSVFCCEGPWAHSFVCREVVLDLQQRLAGSGAKFRDIVDELALAKPQPMSILQCVRVVLLEMDEPEEYTAAKVFAHVLRGPSMFRLFLLIYSPSCPLLAIYLCTEEAQGARRWSRRMHVISCLCPLSDSF